MEACEHAEGKPGAARVRVIEMGNKRTNPGRVQGSQKA